MSVRVRVPTPLRKYHAGRRRSRRAKAATSKSLVDDLENSHPGIKERICDETGKVRRFVNVYVNGDDIRFLQNLETALKEGDNISIVPAIAGGRERSNSVAKMVHHLVQLAPGPATRRRAEKVESILDLIGDTPLLEIQRVSAKAYPRA